MASEREEDELYYDLGDWHWAEVSQAAYMIQSNLQAFLVDHPAIKQTPDLAGRAEVINRLMGELYQAIENLAHVRGGDDKF